MSDLAREIVDTIAAEAGIEREVLTLDANLYDLGIDSLSALEILTTLERKYGITIPENELGGVNRISDVVERVSRCIANRECRAAPG
jgi:acyl carrier protein